jgi:mRNA interferase MazF
LGTIGGERNLVTDKDEEEYMPQTGDIIYVPRSVIESPVGHEQALNRRALVVSINSFNKMKSMAWVCPITNTDRGDRTHIPIKPNSMATTGVIMVDQLRTIDWKERNVTFIEKCPSEYLKEALLLIRKIAFLPPEWAARSS